MGWILQIQGVQVHTDDESKSRNANFAYVLSTWNSYVVVLMKSRLETK